MALGSVVFVGSAYAFHLADAVLMSASPENMVSSLNVEAVTILGMLAGFALMFGSIIDGTEVDPYRC
jgi:hypothetical protein